MARGGSRPGAGRKKGRKNKRSVEQPEQHATYAAADKPLEYMLSVMRDPSADFKRRDEMAKAAAPYLHPRADAGKKAQAAAAADTAGAGTDWGDDLLSQIEGGRFQ